MMRRLALIACLGLLATGCRREQEQRKIIDGLPVNTTETIIPALAAQEFLLLQSHALAVVVAIVNRMSIPNPTFPELSGPFAGSTYQFQTTDAHYGTAIFTIQFINAGNAVIDPIATLASTTTIKSVNLTATPSSSVFPTINENTVLTLATAGDVNSEKRLTGTVLFNGSGNNITFTLPAPGAVSTYQGMKSGVVTAAGTGPSAPVGLTLSISSLHNLDGTIGWESREGTIHLDEDGQGFVITNSERLTFQ